MEVYSFSVYPESNPLGWLYIWFIVAILASITAGYLVYIFSQRLKSIGPNKEKQKKIHKRLGFGIGTILSTLLIGVFYYMFWTNFYQIDLYSDKVVLTYVFPEREVVIDHSQVEAFTYYNRGTRNGLIVLLKNNERYVSMSTLYPTRKIEEVSRELNNIVEDQEFLD